MCGLGRLVKELLAELSVGRLAGDTDGEVGVLDRVWVGVDVGKQHHWVAAVDGEGRVLLSRKVANDQTAITGVLGELKAMAPGLVWTVDLTTVEAALLLAVLWEAASRCSTCGAGRSTSRRPATAGRARPTLAMRG
jgi:Transposase